MTKTNHEKLTRKMVKDLVNKAYSELLDICTIKSDLCSRLFDQAISASRKVERAHGLLTNPKRIQTAELAARFYVCFWVVTARKRPDGWLDAVSTREDIRLCGAIREALGAQGEKYAVAFDGLKRLEYKGDFVE